MSIILAGILRGFRFFAPMILRRPLQFMVFLVSAAVPVSLAIYKAHEANMMERQRAENLSYVKQIESLSSLQRSLEELLIFVQSQKVELR